MAERTRIRVLDHIENQRFERLPQEPYLRGYLLEYARALGLPESAQLVARYLELLPRAETRALRRRWN
jgi:cytoskeletal protein RodZ